MQFCYGNRVARKRGRIKWVKFGAQGCSYRNTWDSIRSVVEVLEDGPRESIWFADHCLPPPPCRDEEHLNAHERFTVVSAVAGFTERLRLGHLVLGNTYRSPALVAKMATTVDQISHGRFKLGIDAAWFEREDEAYGWTFPTMRERQDRLEEAEGFLAARNLGEGSVAGTKNYVMDRTGEMIDTGAYGIMLAGTPTDDLEQYRLVAEEVIPVFD